jgi:hypothetical protein
MTLGTYSNVIPSMHRESADLVDSILTEAIG